MGCTYCMPMANEPGGSVAISHARAALSPALLLRTPHSTYRPLFAHLLPHCVLYFFEEDLTEEGKKKEEGRRGWRHPQLWRGPRAWIDHSPETRGLDEGGAVSEACGWGSELSSRELSNSFWCRHDSSDRIPKAKTPLNMWKKNGTPNLGKREVHTRRIHTIWIFLLA